MKDTILNLVFLVFAVTAVGGALAVAFSQNIVRSAFSLLLVLFSVSALYGLMQADFIFVIQVLVYVGGILVLIIFAVMLTHRIVDVNVSNASTPTPWALAASVCLAVMLVLISLTCRLWYAKSTKPNPTSLTHELGKALMDTYLYPFEIISVLLLACLIGAAFLARKEVRD